MLRCSRLTAIRESQNTMRQFLRNNGLSLVMILTFLALWIGQAIIGRADSNDEREHRGQPPQSMSQYLRSGHFLEATGENWESEFLQMGAFVWLTACLFQVGSPESNDPREPIEEPSKPTSESPWPARRGGWVRAIYSRSLSLAFFGLFMFSMWLHALGGSWEYSAEQVAQGEAPVTFWGYLGTTRFWFESLQNWQSEFLAIASMVILSIFLRHKGSAESKPVDSPNASNG